MYRCSQIDCCKKGTEDPIYHLLICGHSICDHCVELSFQRNDFYIRCGICSESTFFSSKNLSTKQQKYSFPFKTSKKLKNEALIKELPLDVFALGKALNDRKCNLSQPSNLEELIPSPMVLDNTDFELIEMQNNELEIIIEKNSINEDDTKQKIANSLHIFKECGHSLNMIENMKMSIKQSFFRAKTDLVEHFHYIHSLLQLRELELSNKLDEHLASKLSKLNDLEKELKKSRNALKNIINQNIFAKKNSRLKQNLINACQTPCRLVVNKMFNAFCNFDSEFVKKINSYGSFSSDGGLCSIEKLCFPDITGHKNLESSKTDKTPLMSRIANEIVEVTHILTPDDFWIRISDHKGFERLQKQINDWCGKLYQNPPRPNSLHPDDYCFAFSQLHQRWCRAKFIISTSLKDEENLFNFKTKNIVLSDFHVGKNLVAEVHLLDFGNKEIVAFDNIRSKKDDLFDNELYPHQAIHCALCNIKPAYTDHWSDTAIQVFQKFILNKPCDMSVKETVGNKLIINLVHHDCEKVSSRISLVDILLYYDVARIRLNDDRVHHFTTNLMLTYPSREELHNYATVSVANIISPDLFYVTKTKNNVIFNELYEEMSVYDDLDAEVYTLFAPKKGVPAVIKYNGQWSRAIVDEVITKDRIKVFFVDFGVEQIVNLQDLRVMRDEFLRLKKQAIPCMLMDVRPAEGFKWNKNALEKFKNLLTSFPRRPYNLLISVLVNGYDDSGKAMVVVKKCVGPNDICINIEMVKSGLAISTGPASKATKPIDDFDEMIYDEDQETTMDDKSLEELKDFNVSGWNILKEIRDRNIISKASKIESLVKVAITYATSPSEFYLQICYPEVKNYFIFYENKLMKEFKMRTNEDISKKNQFVENEICVYFIQDEFDSYWRRGIVLEKISESEYKIRSKDYGNIVNVNSNAMIKVPPHSSFRKDDDFCIKCNLSGIFPAGGSEWTQTALEVFNDSISKYKKDLYLLTKEEIHLERPESYGIDLIVKEEVIVNPLAPKKINYLSMRFLLVSLGVAIPERGVKIYEDEEDLNKVGIMQNRTQPVTYQCKSILTFLRDKHHRMNEEEATKEVRYLPSILPKSDKWEAVVTDVNHLTLEVWFRMWENKNNSIDFINKSINEALQTKDRLTPFMGPETIGRACSAYFFFDKTWNRGEILSKRDSEYLINFVDYGNKDIVKVEHMSSDVFCVDIPKLALSGILYGCKRKYGISDETLREMIFDLVIDKKCMIERKNYLFSRILKISVTLPDGRDLKQTLLEANLLEDDISEDDDETREMQMILDFIKSSRYSKLNIQIANDNYYPIIVSEPIYRRWLWIQLSFTNKDMSTISKEINMVNNNFLKQQQSFRSEIDEFKEITKIEKGQECCARFSHDGEWYRALVIDVNSEVYKILYVDYGNIEEVFTESLRELPIKYIKYPPLNCFLAKISGIKPADKWTETLEKKIKSCLSDPYKRFMAKFKSNTFPCEIELYEADPTNTSIPGRHAFESMILSKELIICEKS